MRSLFLRCACLGALVVVLARCGAPSDGARDAAADAGPVVDDGGALDATGPDATMEAAPHEVLFVGNSYVFVNDVPARYHAMVSALGASVRTETVAPGGYRWAQHAADAQMDGTPLAHWLREASPEEASFDAVVLQEQSQIGGFPSSGLSSDVRTASILGATELARLANARGALSDVGS